MTQINPLIYFAFWYPYKINFCNPLSNATHYWTRILLEISICDFEFGEQDLWNDESLNHCPWTFSSFNIHLIEHCPSPRFTSLNLLLFQHCPPRFSSLNIQIGNKIIIWVCRPNITIDNGLVWFESVKTEAVWNWTVKIFWNLNRTEPSM